MWVCTCVCMCLQRLETLDSPRAGVVGSHELSDISDLNMNMHNYGHLMFNKDDKSTHWIKDSIYNKWC